MFSSFSSDRYALSVMIFVVFPVIRVAFVNVRNCTALSGTPIQFTAHEIHAKAINVRRDAQRQRYYTDR